MSQVSLAARLCLGLMAIPLFKRSRPKTSVEVCYHPDGSAKAGRPFAEKGFREAEMVLRWFGGPGVIADKQVLDVGCGDGGMAIYYAHAGARHVTGIDIDRIRLARATQFAVDKNVAHKTDFGDAPLSSYSSCCFDVVILNDVIEHLEDPLAVLLECWRVLRPGGSLCANFAPWGNALGSHLNYYIPVPWCHLLFSEKTLIECLARVGRQTPLLSIHLPGITRVPMPDRLSDLGMDHLNHISLSTFRKLVDQSPFELVHYGWIPLGSTRSGAVLPKAVMGAFTVLARLRPLDEYLNASTIWILRK